MTECMSIGRDLYRLNDPEKEKRQGAVHVENFDEADHWSEQHWGIFWTVNDFGGKPRRKENLVRIKAWILDLDQGSKEDQQKTIRRFGLRPSAVHETARGYHAYFDALDAEPTQYLDIEARMCEACGGDMGARDVSRILRVPGYMHWKDVNKPFAVKGVYFSDAKYTQDQLLKFLPVVKDKTEEHKQHLRRELKFQGDKGLFERIWAIDCEEALKRLSGSMAVGGDHYEFKTNSSGTKNIISNGNGTSCWIDRNQRIGSLDKGGPGIWQWLKWYGNNNKQILEIIKQNFPEVEK